MACKLVFKTQAKQLLHVTKYVYQIPNVTNQELTC